jgi:hypothetical protein
MRWAGSYALARFSRTREALRPDGRQVRMQSLDTANHSLTPKRTFSILRQIASDVRVQHDEQGLERAEESAPVLQT